MLLNFLATARFNKSASISQTCRAGPCKDGSVAFNLMHLADQCERIASESRKDVIHKS